MSEVAVKAIEMSRETGEIVHLTSNSGDSDLCQDLSLEADDCAIYSGTDEDIEEYWGSDWRVHVHITPNNRECN